MVIIELGLPRDIIHNNNSTGPKSTLYPSQSGVEGVTGAEVADGVDGCIKAVRRQIGAGADWVKVSFACSLI